MLRLHISNRGSRRSGTATDTLMENLEPRIVLSAATGPYVDDVYEDNNSIAAVNAQEPGAPNSSNLGEVDGMGRIVLQGLRMADRRDLYRVDLRRDAGEFDYVRLNHNVRRGNLDLMLLNDRGKVVLRSQGNTNVEHISLEGLPAGTYFIQVIGRRFQTNPNYQLSVSVDWKEWEHPFGDNDAPLEDFPPADPLDDDLFERGNNTIAQVRAQPIGPYSPNLGPIASSFNIDSLTLADTRDIYRFEITSPMAFGSSIRIHAFEAMNIFLYNSLGDTISFADGYNGNDTISLGGLGAGEYFVAVTHYALDNPPGFDYWLQFTLPAAA